MKNKLLVFFISLLFVTITSKIYTAARIVLEDDNRSEEIPDAVPAVTNQEELDEDENEDDSDEQPDSEEQFENLFEKDNEKVKKETRLTKYDQDLFKYIQEGNLEGVKKAIEGGANINCVKPYLCGKEDCADPCECQCCFSPLMTATFFGHIEIVKYLLDQENININHCIGAENHDGYGCWPYNASLVACQENRLDILKLLLSHNKINFIYQKESWLYDCLCNLIKKNEIEFAEFLINKVGTDINRIDKGDVTNPLISAAKWSEEEDLILIRLLLKSPFLDINKANKVGDTALIVALTGNNGDGIHYDGFGKYTNEIVKLLTTCKKLDLNKKMVDGATALYCSYPFKRYSESHQKESLVAFKHLLTFQRIDPKIRVKIAQLERVVYSSIISLAKRDKNIEVLKLLKDFYTERARLTNELFAAIKRADLKKVREMLLKFTMVVNDENGDTPLQAAVKVGNLGVIKLLLNACPKSIRLMNCKNKDNILHTAIKSGNKDLLVSIFSCVPYLLEIPNSNRQTPLDLVITKIELLALFLADAHEHHNKMEIQKLKAMTFEAVKLTDSKKDKLQKKYDNETTTKSSSSNRINYYSVDEIDELFDKHELEKNGISKKLVNKLENSPDSKQIGIKGAAKKARSKIQNKHLLNGTDKNNDKENGLSKDNSNPSDSKNKAEKVDIISMLLQANESLSSNSKSLISKEKEDPSDDDENNDILIKLKKRRI